MRVLITGATGFIGRALVERLSSAGADIYGFALDQDIGRSRLALDDRTVPAFQLIPVDLRRGDVTAQAVAGVRPDQVVHLAAAGVTDPAIDPAVALEHNTLGSLNLLEACFQNPTLEIKPRRLVVIRTPGEAKPSNAYTASKAATWSFCQMFARRDRWPIVGAMVFQAYGPGQPAHTFVQAALRAALAGDDFAMTSGHQARDWVYLSDVVDGLVALLEAEVPPGDSLDLGSGKRTKLLDMAELAYRLAGRGGTPLPGALAGRPGEEDGLTADVARTAEVLGWKPRVELEEGLKLVIRSLTR